MSRWPPMNAPPCTQTRARPDASAEASVYSRAGTARPAPSIATSRVWTFASRGKRRFSDSVSMSGRGSAGSPCSRNIRSTSESGSVRNSTSVSDMGRLHRTHRGADEVVLPADEHQRIDLAQLGEGVALPLARPVAAIAALDEDAHELRVVDRGLLAVLVDVVELRVDVRDLRHDVGPLARVDVAVHVEREVGERAEAARVEVAGLQVADELLLPLLHGRVGRPDALQFGERVVIQPR